MGKVKRIYEHKKKKRQEILKRNFKTNWRLKRILSEKILQQDTGGKIKWTVPPR